MQNDANEFMFKRKRKRLRAVYTEETEALLPLDQVTLQSELITDIAALPEPLAATSFLVLPDVPIPPSAEAASEDVITVDKFLRSSVQKATVPPRKRRAYTHRCSAQHRTTRVRKVTKVSKGLRESSGIAKTLFRAAVLTDGDPRDTLVVDAGISHTRRPLKFVPFNKFAEHVRPGESDSTELPGCGRPERTVLQTRHHGSTSNFKQRHDTSQTRTPLCLVPLRDAEVAYSTMFP